MKKTGHAREYSTLPGDVAFRSYVDRMKVEAGCTLDQLAEKLEIAPTTLSNWRRRPEMMSVYSLRQLVRAGMTVEELLAILEVEP